jgi:hypothetical protein
MFFENLFIGEENAFLNLEKFWDNSDRQFGLALKNTEPRGPQIDL